MYSAAVAILRSLRLSEDDRRAHLKPLLLRFDQRRVVGRFVLFVLKRTQLRQHRVVVLGQVSPEIALAEFQLPRRLTLRNAANGASQAEYRPRKAIAQLDGI